MARIAYHLELCDGKEEIYRKEHEQVPAEVEAAYLESGAGLHSHSVFVHDGHVFGFIAVDKPDELKKFINNSSEQEKWREVMDPLLKETTENIWMDEVYRMI